MAQESSEQESVEHEFRIRFTARDLEILEGALARDLLARSDGALDDTTVEDFVWRKFVVGARCTNGGPRRTGTP